MTGGGGGGEGVWPIVTGGGGGGGLGWRDVTLLTIVLGNIIAL